MHSFGYFLQSVMHLNLSLKAKFVIYGHVTRRIKLPAHPTHWLLGFRFREETNKKREIEMKNVDECHKMNIITGVKANPLSNALAAEISIRKNIKTFISSRFHYKRSRFNVQATNCTFFYTEMFSAEHISLIRLDWKLVLKALDDNASKY